MSLTRNNSDQFPHLNEGEEQPPDQVDLRDDEDEIDLPSREVIESTLKYLKNKKVACVDLLKNGGPQLVNALQEVIQLAWTSVILRESWTKRVLF
jgi:hypothetical protein